MVNDTLAHREGRMTGGGFVRVHRKVLVRLAAVREISAAVELQLPEPSSGCR
jgi:DNA-binding LytR/AlgR family response regulator